MIAQHHRDNHERTAEALYRLEGLLIALDIVFDELPVLHTNSRETSAIRTLHEQIMEIVEQAKRAQRMNWVGLGGKSDLLTDAEIAEAIGQQGEA